MKTTCRVRDGFVAGLLAGLVVVFLFVFYDLGQRAPLQTPAFLWAAITRQAFTVPMAVAIIGFVVIHFLAWGGLGTFAVFLIRWLSLPLDVLIGATYGLLFASSVFYLSVSGIPEELVFSAPSWPAVLFVNGVGGAVMFLHMERSSVQLNLRSLMRFFRPNEVTRQGFYTGLVGGSVVGVWFLILDVILRGPLYTPATLGMILFQGGVGTGIGSVDVTLMPALGYGLWHFAFFMMVGVLMWVHFDVGATVQFLFLQLLCVSIALDLSLIVMAVSLESWILRELTWWAILIGNGLAAVAMGGYLMKRRPYDQKDLWLESL